jgi:hypothetical protein
MTSPWITPFIYVAVVTKHYSLYEALQSGDTLKGWWNGQRMWLVKRITSYLFGFIDTVKKKLGMSNMGFMITPKVSNDEDQAKRYEQEIMEFGTFSTEFMIVATIALLNPVCLVGGLSQMLMRGSEKKMFFDAFSLQFVLCGVMAIVNLPIYEAMFLRKDRGRIPLSVTIASTGLVIMLASVL